MKHLLSLKELTRQEIESVFKLADQARDQPASLKGRLPGKTLALLFERPSTRTRVAFEVAMAQLGGTTLFLRREDTHLARGEEIADTARSLSQFVDCIAGRVAAHQDILDLAKHASVPVINALSGLLHPLQALTDLYTLHQRRGSTDGLKIGYVGDGNNVCHELIFGAVKLGLAITVASPKGYEPSPAIVKISSRDAQKAGTPVPVVTSDVRAAVAGADVVYTDVWTSMGVEEQADERQQALAPYAVTAELMAAAEPDAVFMHPMPLRRGLEVAAEVADGPQSVVFEQVKNRLFVQKALLVLLLG